MDAFDSRRADELATLLALHEQGSFAAAGRQLVRHPTVLSKRLGIRLVERSTHGRTHHYQPTKGPEELAAERMRLLLARGSDRRTVLRQFVQGLDAHDEQILRDVLGGAL